MSYCGKVHAIALVAALLPCGVAVDFSFAGQTCTNNGGTTPWVCITMENVDPVEDTDFRFDIDPMELTKPGITLFTGNSGWIISSQVSESDTTPADLGDIKIEASVATAEFGVSFTSGTGVGAANVGSILLADDTNWTGFSSITDSSITGDLLGDLKVIKSGADGGVVNMSISGDVHGDMEIYEIEGLTVFGDLVGGGLVKVAQLTGKIEIGGLDKDLDISDVFGPTPLVVNGGVSSTATIKIGTWHEQPSVISLNEDAFIVGNEVFAGDLVIMDGANWCDA